MPYILDAKRKRALAEGEAAQDEGELNYCITLLAVRFLDDHGLSYANCQRVSGAMGEAQAEFRRRVMAPYEHDKMRDNGDVYPAHLVNGVDGWKQHLVDLETQRQIGTAE